MPLNTEFLIALAKLAATFTLMLVLLRLKLRLWQAIMAGCIMIAGMALYSGASPAEIIRTPVSPLQDEGFLLMEVMIFGIMLLSGIQEATGQSHRLVEAMERYLRWPRLRLVVFPALVGFLPMPGGALFSCPMLDAATHGLDISPERKSLINYWFRHIWETTWPLYPGFVLACSLVDIPLYTLMPYTFPLVILSISIGWFFFIRDIKIPEKTVPESAAPETGAGARPKRSLRAILYESLPILITIFGAAAFGVIIGRLAPEWPSQAAFVCSLAVANLTAWLQGRRHMSASLRKIVLNKRSFGLVFLIYIIFVFKDMIGASGIVTAMSHAGGSLLAVGAIFILLPLACAMLTGVMVGYVGASFPILLGIIAEGGLEQYTLPLVVLAISSGQIGQLGTPLHVCIAVTCEYYRVHFSDIWRDMMRPLALLLAGGLLWVGTLFALGASF